MASSEDTEITLGVGRLLGLFFLLAAICGVFFSIGYSLGRSSGREQAANDQSAQAAASAEAAPASSGLNGSKPSAAVGSKSEGQISPSDEANPGNQQSNLTFYKAVQQSGSGAATAPEPAQEPVSEAAAQKATAAASAPVPASSAVAALTAASTRAGPDVISHTSPVTGPGTMVVQIAALSREDDAVALAGALRKKNYNVFVVNNPVTRDKLYHVQVGPFATLAEAEAMRAKLIAEGYNPIIKR